MTSIKRNTSNSKRKNRPEDLDYTVCIGRISPKFSGVQNAMKTLCWVRESCVSYVEDSVKNCRFCGGKIQSDAFVCPHCQKTLRKSEGDSSQNSGGSGSIRLDEWSKFRVPAWVMYLVIALSAFTLYIMVTGAFKPKPVNNPDAQKTNDEDKTTMLRVLEISSNKDLGKGIKS